MPFITVHAVPHENQIKSIRGQLKLAGLREYDLPADKANLQKWRSKYSDVSNRYTVVFDSKGSAYWENQSSMLKIQHEEQSNP